MFFKNVYGKIQLYPYLHVVTWGLPRRYFGLLRLFNLQLEENPHYFISQCPHLFANNETPSTSISLPAICIKQKPLMLTDVSSKHQLETEENGIEPRGTLAQGAGGKVPPSKTGRRSRKKPVISIKIKLDDDLKTLKSRSKNFEKVFSRGKQKSYLLVIEKSKSSKRDEFCLNIVDNNANFSQPFNKLLKKNKTRRKASLQTTSESFTTATEPKKYQSSEFTAENIYPPLNKFGNLPLVDHNEELFLKACTNYCRLPQDSSSEKIGGSIKSKKGKEFETTHQTNGDSGKPPSQLIVHEEPPLEEKPLRNWPIITQVFTVKNFEILKNFFQPTPSNEDEKVAEEEENDNSSVTKEDTILKSTITENVHKTHNKLDAPLKTQDNESKTENKNIKNSDTSSDTKALNTQTSGYITPIPKSFNSVSNLSSFSEICLRRIASDSDQLSSFMSTHSIYLNASDKMQDHNEISLQNNIWQSASSKFSLTGNLVHSRLLSSSVKTYESINIPEQDDEICGALKGEGLEENKSENNIRNNGPLKESSKSVIKTNIKFQIVCILIPILITIVLGVVLFITVYEDGNTSFTDNYFKRSNK